MVALSDYTGREQSYVKHVFLERYLERLVHKTASIYPHIVYVDGFAGPWQSASERFEDTSFGIALNALRRAKASWKDRGRDVKTSAFLVERDAEAYKQLAQVSAKYPDISIKTYAADFLAVLPHILRDISADAFAFFLIDPKGWLIPLKTLAPMLARPKSEVIFNFMFDFINRAANIKEPSVVTGLDELIPFGDWRSTLEAAERSRRDSLSSDERKEILVEAFASNLAHFGNYLYVAETTVLRPVKDRPLYCLFYATRHEKGIEVFRDCQAEALQEQSKTRAATKVRHAEARSGQAEIFQSLHDMGPNDLTAFVQAERTAAERTLLGLTPEEPGAIQYEKLWPQVLARHVVRKTDVNQIAARLRAEGKLSIPDWERGKRVPQPMYRIQRPKTGTNVRP
jgi:three-Cys-motif partner protein